MIEIRTSQTFEKIIPNLTKKVIFIGTKYRSYLSHEDKYSYTSIFSQERERMILSKRNELINFDAQIIDVLDPLWLASDLAENNLCLENFSLYILNSLVLIKNILPIDNNILLICDDDEQVFVYSKILKNNGFYVTAYVNYAKLLKRVLGYVSQKCLSFCQSIYKSALLKTLRLYYGRPISLTPYREANILCINWVGLNSFNHDKLFLKNRYFGDLLSQLENSGFKVAIIGKTLDFSASFLKIVKNALLDSKEVLFFRDFLSFRDILFSFIKSFSFLKYWNHKFKIDEIDFSCLWRWFCFKDILKARISTALEAYYASQKIFLKSNKSDITLIYPYENQPWEKLLSLAFKEIFPHSKIFAYQHFPFAKNYLTAFPSKTYIATNRVPCILLSDTFFGEWLRENGFTDHFLLGNFRFSLSSDKAKGKAHFVKEKKRKILCSCSIQFNDSLELFTKTIKVIEKLDYHDRENIGLIVNFHPLMPQNERIIIKKFLNNKEIDIEFSDLDADEIIDECEIIFYNSNSICFNAALRGIPAIFLYSNFQINLDRIPEASIKVNTIEEGVNIISHLLNKKEFYLEKSNNIRGYFNSYYYKPDYSVIRNLLLTEV